MARLQLTIVSQERELISTHVDRLTVPGSEGELTILPGHVPIVTRLVPGVIEYEVEKRVEDFAVSRGFLTVSGDNQAIVMVDSAVEARAISLAKAEEAVARAQEAITISEDRREKLKAEAELRYALLQLHLAERTKRSS